MTSQPRDRADRQDATALDAAPGSRSDLTGFAALLGESLASRVGLLERLLRGAHYPSLGQYKQRLLADTIRRYLPQSVEVATGFVLFPHEDDSPAAGQYHDPLNQSAFAVSRQCDILVFDAARFPPIFRDGDFVVLRPESVRAVIEVKGAINLREMRSALESFHDFAVKWRTTQLFYAAHSQSVVDTPGLHVLAWEAQRRRPGGAPAVSPARLARAIAEFYAEKVPIAQADGYPFLTQCLLYDECEISAMDADGQPFRHRDRTVASLLASLHYSVARNDFNRFFSYADEIRARQALPYRHEGIHWAYVDLRVEDARQLTARNPRQRA